jgi:hypothetical protein
VNPVFEASHPALLCFRATPGGEGSPLRRHQPAYRTYSRQFLRILLGRLKSTMTLRRRA